MPMQGLYELDVMDRAGDRAADRASGLAKSIAPWIFVLVLMVVVSTVLAIDASLTAEQRIATFQQSGVFP